MRARPLSPKCLLFRLASTALPVEPVGMGMGWALRTLFECLAMLLSQSWDSA